MVNFYQRYRFSWVLGIFLSLFFCVGVQAEQVLLFDDFNGPALDTTKWGLATWNLGDRTQFGNSPIFVTDGSVKYASLPLDTYHPGAPGQRVLGTEIFSLEKFDNTNGIEYLAKARLNISQGGLVAAFFTYGEQIKHGTRVSDEIDYEVLSKQAINRVLMTSWNDWGAAGSQYDDGVHHLGAFPVVTGYDWREWNTYAMIWYPDRVEWYVNDVLVRTNINAIPDIPQPIRASLWAGGTTWPDAYDSSLNPVSTQASNQHFSWDIDYIMVTRLGAGGSDVPAPPTGLIASVAGKDVQLSWTDAANNESEFIVYRAWKPKGKSSPDFSAVEVLGANANSYLDKPPDGQHIYQVTASNSTGESAPSNRVTVTVGSGSKGHGKP